MAVTSDATFHFFLGAHFLLITLLYVNPKIKKNILISQKKRYIIYKNEFIRPKFKSLKLYYSVTLNQLPRNWYRALCRQAQLTLVRFLTFI